MLHAILQRLHITPGEFAKMSMVEQAFIKASMIVVLDEEEQMRNREGVKPWRTVM